MTGQASSWKITVLDPPHTQDAANADILSQFKKLRKRVMEDPERRGVFKNFPLERYGDDVSSFAIATYQDENGQEKVLSGVRFLMVSEQANMKELMKPAAYDTLMAACPEIADRQIKVAKVDLPASEIMPADISPIDIAYALYDKSLEWAKDKHADVLVCAPIPAHAKMIERYSQGRKLPMQNLGKFDDVTQEGVVKEKLLYGM